MQFLCHILKIMRKLLTRFPIANTIASEILVFLIPDARSHQFHVSYASDSLVFLIPDARTTNFMLPMHRKLLFFSFSMPAPPISCFLCIGNSYFSHSRCPHHQFHASYASETLIFPILDARSHKTCLTLTAYRLSSPSYIDLIGMSTAITSVPTISAINTMISGSIAASTLWVVISTSSS